jgi:hypothetical protein
MSVICGKVMNSIKTIYWKNEKKAGTIGVRERG